MGKNEWVEMTKGCVQQCFYLPLLRPALGGLPPLDSTSLSPPSLCSALGPLLLSSPLPFLPALCLRTCQLGLTDLGQPPTKPALLLDR
jgi:hypothetical protein